MMIRGLLKSCLEGVVKRFSATGMIDVEDREYLQHYGLTSRPQPGAEMVYQVQGNLVIALSSDDRRYRLRVEQGEVALYDDLGQKVHLSRGGILIQSGQITTDGYAVFTGHAEVGTGKSGTFVDKLGKVVTVRDGIIVGLD